MALFSYFPLKGAAAAPAPPHFGCGGEPRPRVPSETGNDHKNLLHARRRHLCLERAFAVDPDCDGWSVTLNGVDVPFWVSWIVVTFQKADLSLAVESTKDTPSPIFP